MTINEGDNDDNDEIDSAKIRKERMTNYTCDEVIRNNKFIKG